MPKEHLAEHDDLQPPSREEDAEAGEDRVHYQYIEIEDRRGVHKVILHSADLHMSEELRTEIVQSNEESHVFIFSVVNYIQGEKVRTYFFVKKSNDYVDALINDSI